MSSASSTPAAAAPKKDADKDVKMTDAGKDGKDPKAEAKVRVPS